MRSPTRLLSLKRTASSFSMPRKRSTSPRGPASAKYSPLADQLTDRAMHKSREILDDAYGECSAVWTRYKELPRFEGPMAEMITRKVDESVRLPAAISVLDRALAHLRGLQQNSPDAPKLSFGRAEISTYPDVATPLGHGRTIRVPVINAQGAAAAPDVHASIDYLPDDRDGSFSPRDPLQGVWTDDERSSIHMPGNGQAHRLDVALVIKTDVFGWDRRMAADPQDQSRLLNLAVESWPAHIKIQVRGSGPTGSAQTSSLTRLKLTLVKDSLKLTGLVPGGTREPTPSSSARRFEIHLPLSVGT